MRNRNFMIGAAVTAAGAVAAYVCGVRPWHLRWGATDEDLNEPLIGYAEKLARRHAEPEMMAA